MFKIISLKLFLNVFKNNVDKISIRFQIQKSLKKKSIYTF
ncbi:hypothetical protein LEP1GSC082_1545 [Leptospira kirschneri str. H2]|uniref:Uncharacterized protein n=2 Tax=Leptospira kirschneri TaxID=29507 RepID=A0A0E2B8H5_9LEPT|nr:hypothetical protein LEP1GSC081_2142 [Leptospira kirschneri str. H1]EKO63047.1 hypothetical protein LEP1GSC082_1545 [Leptospira kirschneri str. H2]EMK25623.1 hypothetical protein LEP1GSC008_3809 [Leptospira kirschneri serovar Bulgarica str. Nikolaevo]